MKITRTSAISGVTRTREIDVTQAELDDYLGGELIQRAMPNVSADDREFIMTGITSEEWEALVPNDDD